MSTLTALQIMKNRPKNSIEFEFDNMMMPHWSWYLSQADVDALRYIATSKRLSGDVGEKLKRIKAIMNARGFVKFAGGTNRVIYRYLEDDRFLAKVAIDAVGMADNPAEFDNQWLIRPYCTRTFQVTECGTVGFAERVLPITSIQEFKTAADDIFEILYNRIIGKFIVEDVGTEYFMNYGIRFGKEGYGSPVLLDYPYVFELDGATIICRNQLPNGMICGGEIDYDAGFNNLICKRCGRKYLAKEMQKDRSNNRIIIKKGGTNPMNVQIKKGNRIIAQSYNSDIIVKPASGRDKRLQDTINASTLQAKIMKNGTMVTQENLQLVADSDRDIKVKLNDIKSQIARNTEGEKEKKEEVESKQVVLNTAPQEPIEEKVEEKKELEPVTKKITTASPFIPNSNLESEY